MKKNSSIILLSFLLFIGCGDKRVPQEEGIKAFCIDFNWGDGGPNRFAAPGLWASAVPEEHVNGTRTWEQTPSRHSVYPVMVMPGIKMEAYRSNRDCVQTFFRKWFVWDIRKACR